MLFGFANILEYHIRKIMQFFLYKQNTLLLYVVMSFRNFFVFKSYVWIKYMFYTENRFYNVYDKN